ncbi:MAG: M48 family metalloprotease [Pseudomonadota bacterium]
MKRCYEGLLRGCALALLTLAGAGCVVNPVTGKSEITLISAAQEVQLGAQNYQPMQQSQGGIFRLDPAVNRYVSDVGQRIAAVSPRDLPYEFVVLNNSVPNAWALPGGKIAINRGLLMEMQSEAELASVLGHEIVHAAAKHSAKQMQRGMFLQALVLGTAVVTSDSDYGNLAAGAANIGAQALSQTYSRGAELESDFYGMKYMSEAGYDPEGAVDLQRTFLRLANARGQTQGFNIFASHPPSQQRLATNIITASELPPGGKVGRDDFAAMMSTLRASQPAFEAYDAGRKALADGDLSAAERKAREAIRLQPREASFYGLAGDAALMRKNYDTAIASYTNALDRDATFFYYHLQRGIARERSGDVSRAEADLTTSLKLFETAPAYYSLGNLALKRRDTQSAKQYYAKAAGSQGEIGNAARAELMRLDLASNPSAYLQTRAGTDAQGQLLIAVNNPNPLAVRALRFEIRYLDSAGQTRSITRALNSVLGAKQNTTIATGLGPFTSSNQYQVQLIGAALAE